MIHTDPVLATSVTACAARLLSLIGPRRPKVHCITNTVAQPLTANVLLSAGAVPSLTTAQEEIAAFARSADVLLLNLGTLDAERRRAIEVALDQGGGLPWLLDPVFVDRSSTRRDFAATLVKRKPSVLRLNAGEFTALAGRAPSADAVRAYAKATGAVVALTGATDFVSDGLRSLAVRNGHALMSMVTAMGCAGSAFIAAALVVEDDPLIATAAALIAFGVAGEVAAARSKGPGSFAVEIIDAIHGLTFETIVERTRVTVEAVEGSCAP